jgi:hypothetical protein
VRKLATLNGLAVRRIAELPLPSEMAQGRFDFEGPEGTKETEEAPVDVHIAIIISRLRSATPTVVSSALPLDT